MCLFVFQMIKIEKYFPFPCPKLTQQEKTYETTAEFHVSNYFSGPFHLYIVFKANQWLPTISQLNVMNFEPFFQGTLNVFNEF